MSKSGAEKALQKGCMSSQVDQQQPSHVPSVVGTATPELVFTVTTDAAKWVQIYGLLRPTDANEMRSCYHVILLSYHRVIMSSCYHVILLSCFSLF